MIYSSLFFYFSSLNNEHQNEEIHPLNWTMMGHELLVVDALHQ